MKNISDTENYLKETTILNYSGSTIQELVKKRNWQSLEPVQRVKEIYNYVVDLPINQTVYN